jgi:hypothetical protein
LSLKTDYKNYVPTEDMGGLRRYTKIDNPDGTVSFQDVTTYEVEGSKYGADDANATNKAINTIMGSGVEVTYEEGTVKITAPEGMTMVTFIAPSNYSASDKYTINDDEITLSDLNGEPLDDAWKQGSPVTLTLNGNKAFFKAGGGKVPADLPPLLPNFALEFSGTTVTVTANKLPLNDKTSMLAGGVWVLASTIPDSPKGAIVQQRTAADLIDSTQDTESTEVVTWTYPNWSAGEPIYCRQYTYNAKGQYNTSLYGGLVSTEDAPPFALPEFTGNHAIFGDETAGRIELYESGTLTLYPGTYDFFLVGGGASGVGGGNETSTAARMFTGGGGSGYTITKKDFKVSDTIAIDARVGAGGSMVSYSNSLRMANAGTASSLTHKLLPQGMIYADGGKNTASGGDVLYGTDGGCGGGTNLGGYGGTDGSNGKNASNVEVSYTKGQGTTTRAFEEIGNTLYCGGGGGATAGTGLIKNGGSPGGGRGAYTQTSSKHGGALPGTANTGGGGGGGISYNVNYHYSSGAGGSGIIIIRWNNT